MKKKPSAFSLLEISIAITIITLLVVGILQGGELIRKSKVRAAASLTKSSVVPKMDGLVLWLETTMPNSFLSNQATDGSAISTWYDISNSSVTSTNATAGVGPIYTTGGMNGLPVLRFNGAQYLTFNGSIIANSNFTIFIVSARRSSDASNFILGGPSNVDRQTLNVGYDANDSFTSYLASESIADPSLSDSISYTCGDFKTPTFQIHSITLDISAQKYYENGVLRQTGNTTVAPKLASWSTATIGRWFDPPSTYTYFNGDIGEIIMFNRALNDQERQDVETYLSKKWEITIS